MIYNHRMKRPFVLIVLLALGCQKPSQRVVVACAQDREFAEPLFAAFESSAKLTVAPKFDTEANKSVSLAAELVAEKDRPRADVHWNNELIATIRLANQGIYEAYSSPSATGYPAWSRGTHWQAFAARARVLIVNTKLVPESERPKSLLDLTAAQWKGKLAMAKPLFGTTATQAVCLMEALGEERTKAWYRGLKANDIAIVPGNKQVAVGVAEGRFAIGMTDTDDALIELDAGKPVAVIFPDRDTNDAKLGVLFIPNALALVKGGPNPNGGKAMIDFLLTRDGESRLASAGGFQIPLHPECKVKLHPALAVPSQVKVMAVDWQRAADRWEATQEFLRNLFP
jgi:iron(III) transport system substrate-binding protein